MCGICGIFHRDGTPVIELQAIKGMVRALRHRGPDGHGLYADDDISLGHARLSIIDLQGGTQPLRNEDQTIWMVCNGEIFNYVELRLQLERRGHCFRTKTDVEVLIHLYEEKKEKLLQDINGQFAFAIWDKKAKRLLLARDHVGICPLHYFYNHKKFAFASEIKALLTLSDILPALNKWALVQAFTFWCPLTGQTPFEEIFEIKPGNYMWVNLDSVVESQYWFPRFGNTVSSSVKVEAVAEELRELLDDAVRLRLRSDVPVGAYLSGGLDSSITTALVKKNHNANLRTFSIGFENPHFDETPYQERVSKYLQTDHSYVKCSSEAIARVLPEIIWHTEKPILRTSPSPLFMLSHLVRRNNFKVVLTGEGADEFFSGYNIFKETKLRYFNALQPDSKLRPLLYRRLYPYHYTKDERMNGFWQSYFQKGYTNVADIFYSHRLRWQHGKFIRQFLSLDVQQLLRDYDPVMDLETQLGVQRDYLQSLHPVDRAHFLETYLFLGNYLLNSQGDRMLMGHSVEGRYPFLDRRVIEFANALPRNLKLRGLNEKWILKNTFAHLLPKETTARKKQPYRAPVNELIKCSQYLFNEFTSRERLSEDGLFDTQKVANLCRKIEMHAGRISAREEMAWIAIITTEILVDAFLRKVPSESRPDLKFYVWDFRTNALQKQLLVS